jgi:hypothetical protein
MTAQQLEQDRLNLVSKESSSIEAVASRKGCILPKSRWLALPFLTPRTAKSSPSGNSGALYIRHVRRDLTKPPVT